MKLLGLILVSLFFFIGPIAAKVNLEQGILQAIEQYSREKIGSEEVRLNITLKKTGRDYSGEADEIKLLEVYQGAKPVGNVILPFEIINDGNSSRVFVRAQVEALKNLVVANKKIERGQQIKEADLAMEERDVSNIPDKYFTNPDFLLINQSKTTIPQGSIIFEWMVKEIPLIRHGEEVMIRIVGDNIKVETRGKVLEDGYPQQMVKLRANNAKEIVEGKVIAPNIVEVKI